MPAQVYYKSVIIERLHLKKQFAFSHLLKWFSHNYYSIKNAKKLLLQIIVQLKVNFRFGNFKVVAPETNGSAHFYT